VDQHVRRFDIPVDHPAAAQDGPDLIAPELAGNRQLPSMRQVHFDQMFAIPSAGIISRKSLPDVSQLMSPRIFLETAPQQEVHAIQLPPDRDARAVDAGSDLGAGISFESQANDLRLRTLKLSKKRLQFVVESKCFGFGGFAPDVVGANVQANSHFETGITLSCAMVLGLSSDLVQGDRQEKVPQIAGIVNLELSIRSSAKERAKGRLQHISGFEPTL
jgi:hypothetical protein